MDPSLPSDPYNLQEVTNFEKYLPKEHRRPIIRDFRKNSNISTFSSELPTGTEYETECVTDCGIDGIGIDPTRFYAVSAVRTSPLVEKHSEIFQVFHRQDSAFFFFDEIIGTQSCNVNVSSPLKVYSFESVKSGQRKFLVANYSTFFQRYLQALPSKIENQLKSSGNVSYPTICGGELNYSEFNSRGAGDDGRMHEKAHTHVYEIIRDNVPCRAYFDLEYERAFNADVDGDHLTSLWINLVVWKIFELYDIVLGKKDIIVLDSSTPKKYSKHVILIIPVCKCTKYVDTLELTSMSPPGTTEVGDLPDGERTSEEYLFRSNITVGSLVSLIMNDITEKGDKSMAPQNDDVLQQRTLEVEDMHAEKGTDKRYDLTESTLADRDVQGEFHRELENDVNLPSKGIIQGYEKLWVKKENGKTTCFVDLGVYTRNRAFRLWNSSKFGKNVPFQVLFQDRKKYLGLSNSIM